ncbi:MAG TPA: response regulator [Clostridia bacterium]|nr:response regulator [Clostridia bacterium]
MSEILIVDDAVFMRKIISDVLDKNGFNVVGEASNGIEAIEMYKELKPTLVLMDITMPEKNGIEAVKDIIAIDPGAKVIMCSAMGQDSMVKESIVAGAKDFIVKPFQSEDVLKKVKNLIRVG